MSNTGSLDSRLYRRLLVDVALNAGYHVRLEQRSWAGRSIIRIVHPLEFRDAERPDGEGILTVCLIGRSHQRAFSLNEITTLSLATEHMPTDLVCRPDLTVGDAVEHDAFGPGVVQSFPDGSSGDRACVLFADHGTRVVSVREAGLRILPTAKLARRTT